MGWWTTLGEQVSELWQQLLYTIELTSAGSDDLPWLDTLNFFWDSLPDADKLTTAERRRLAHSVKLLVRQAVQDHYDKQISQKQAIHRRQLRRQQAQAELRIQQLAEKRQAEMRALSETARQQSMVLPSVSDLSSLVEGLGFESEQQIQQFKEQYKQYLDQWQASRQHSRQQSRLQSRSASQKLPGAAATAGSSAAAAAASAATRDHLAINLQKVLEEIQPVLEGTDCHSSSRCGSPLPQQQPAVHDDLQQPLLQEHAAAPAGELPLDYVAWREQQQQQHHWPQQGSYVAPAVLQQDQQQPADAPQQQQQSDQQVVINIKPLNSRSVVHSGSQLLLQRYLDSSQQSAAFTQSASGQIHQQQQQHPAALKTLQPTNSDLSSDGLDVRTSSFSTADQSSAAPGHRSSTSSTAPVTPHSTCSGKMGVECAVDCSTEGFADAQGGDVIMSVGTLLSN